MTGGGPGLFESEPMAVAAGAAVVIQFAWHAEPSDAGAPSGRAEPIAVLSLDGTGVAAVLLGRRPTDALARLTQTGPIPSRELRAAIGHLAWQFADGRGTVVAVYVEGGTPAPIGPGRVIELPGRRDAGCYNRPHDRVPTRPDA